MDTEGENTMNHQKERSNDNDPEQGKNEMNIELELKDAVFFLKHAKDLLKKEESKFNKLLHLIQNLSRPSVPREDVFRELKELLKGYPSLASAFNAFCPEGDEIDFWGEDGETAICSEERTVEDQSCRPVQQSEDS